MNKKNLITIILSFLYLFLYGYCYYKMETLSNFIVLALTSFCFLIPIYLYKLKDKIKKYKSVYNVTSMISYVLGFLGLIYIFIECLTKPFNVFFFEVCITTFILDIIIDSLLNIRINIKDTTNNLCLVILIIMNLIFIRALFEPNFSILFNNQYNEYLSQNYIYFFIMLLTMEIQKYINKKTA